MLQTKIKIYIKNGKDISNLIKDQNINGLDLSHAKINSLDLSNQKIENVNFFKTIFGEEGSIINFTRTQFKNCNFAGSVFKSKTIFDYSKSFGCRYNKTIIPYASYQYSKFDENCEFCGIVLPLGTKEGIGADFSNNFFRDLSKHWKVKIIKENQE